MHLLAEMLPRQYKLSKWRRVLTDSEFQTINCEKSHTMPGTKVFSHINSGVKLFSSVIYMLFRNKDYFFFFFF